MFETSEASVIARKVRDYIVVENDPELDMIDAELEAAEAKNKIGPIRNTILICLMSIAVIMTQATLVLVKWIKIIEKKDS